MLVLNYIVFIIILISLGILYHKYIEKQSRTISNDNYSELQKYFMDDKKLDKNKKPLLWIYIPYEYNSRDWLSFGSRSSHNLNQPYLYLTVKSIIKNCDKSFNIVLVDDMSFEKLIPNWNVDMKLLANPIKGYMAQLAMMNLIYTYGGINVPISFLCFKDLITLFDRGTNDDTMFICEKYDSNITSTNKLFYPSIRFMGAKKENNTIKQLIGFMEHTISNDYTAQNNFLGEFDEWCNKKITKGKARLIQGTNVGTRTIDDEPVIVETLLGEDYINFYDKMYGIWIPDDMLLKRRKYEWFVRMSPEQIFESRFILAKYMILTLAPDNNNTEQTENFKPDWIGFWRVPLGNGTLNVYGLKPDLLGDNVPREKNSGNLP